MQTKEYKKQYRLNNKEKIATYEKQYRKENREKQLLYIREYRRKNKKKINEYRRKKRKENPNYGNIPYDKKVRNTWEYRFSQWKSSAEQRELKFDLNLEYLKSLPFKCAYSGVELTLEPNKFNTISLDRIDSSKHYSNDNINLCCVMVNYMKSDYNLNDFIDMCKKISIHSN